MLVFHRTRKTMLELGKLHDTKGNSSVF